MEARKADKATAERQKARQVMSKRCIMAKIKFCEFRGWILYRLDVRLSQGHPKRWKEVIRSQQLWELVDLAKKRKYVFIYKTKQYLDKPEVKRFWERTDKKTTVS